MSELYDSLLELAQQLEPEHRARLLAVLEEEQLRVTTQTWVPVEDDDAAVPVMPSRYEDLGLLGKGGMGEVRRVRDHQLRREVAMKILRQDAGRRSSYSRFVAEAQTMGQLEHPGVVPVYDLGTLADGRPYFVMQEIRGTTLAQIIAAVHHGQARGWTVRRMVSAFQDVCATMAYAHARGVVHRDLKPSNIMLGSFGEVLVVDWGLTKVTSDEGHQRVDTLRSQSGEYTVVGRIAGTPRFMAPEQAHGQIAEVGPQTDVFALGLVLHEILAGRSPYRATTIQELQAEVMVIRDHLFVDCDPPAELRQLVEDCLAPRGRDRPAHAGVVEARVRQWLEGAKRRDEALQMVREGLALLPEAQQLRARADTLAADAEQALEAIPTWASSEDKRGAWQLQDQAKRLGLRAQLQQAQALNHLEAALAKEPSLVEAHDALADFYHQAHERAEAHGDLASAQRAAWKLQKHGAERYAAYLRGQARLRFGVSPPQKVRAWRLVERDRRLVPEEPRDLGTTPLDVALDAGSWLLEWGSGAEMVRYPVNLERGQVWEPVDPVIDASVEVPRGWCWIPPGYSWFGSDRPEDSKDASPWTRAWCHGFLIQELPVTHATYLAYLQELVDRGDGEEAFRVAPRDRSAREGMLGELLYGFDGTTWSLAKDRVGVPLMAQSPVIQVDFDGAQRYAAHVAEKMGRAVRLPSEWEWERAARGADGRVYPMGNHIDGSWSNYWDSHHGVPQHRPVGSFALDRSPFGVRDCTGGAMCWCLEDWEQPMLRDGERVRVVHKRAVKSRVIRGAHYASRNPVSSWRQLAPPNYRGRGLGIRLVIPLDGAPPVEYE